MAGSTRKRPTRRGGEEAKRGSPSHAASPAMDAAARAVLAAPALFFTLERARFYDPRRLTRVITVQLPVQHIRTKQAMHEFVLKKLLHRPFALPAATEGAPPAAAGGPSSASSRTPDATHEDTTEDPYMVVHVSSIEPHADTVRQANAKGDVELNVMVTLTVARVRHGVLYGCSAASPYEHCFQVIVPCEDSSSTARGSGGRKAAKGKRGAAQTADALKGLAGADGGVASVDAPLPENADEVDNADVGPGKLRITARCLEEEPVVSGQAVFVVSEPGGSIRCMAVRPPRAAPGPFRVVAAAEAAAAAAAAAEEEGDGHPKRGRGQGKGGDATAGSVDASVPGAAQLLCDLPPKDAGERSPAKGAPRNKTRRTED